MRETVNKCSFHFCYHFTRQDVNEMDLFNILSKKIGCSFSSSSEISSLYIPARVYIFVRERARGISKSGLIFLRFSKSLKFRCVWIIFLFWFMTLCRWECTAALKFQTWFWLKFRISEVNGFWIGPIYNWWISTAVEMKHLQDNKRQMAQRTHGCLVARAKIKWE